MLKAITIAFIVLVHLSNSSCTINQNSQLLIDVEPILVKQVKNGQRLIIGDESDPDRNYIWVANLKGTPFQMGEAYGSLFASELKDQITNFYAYYQKMLIPTIEKNFPKFIVPLIQKNSIQILKTILQLNVLITKKYTNPRYFEEAKGIAKGAQISAKQINLLNIFPQLVRAHCTVAGVWGEASKDKHTLHMRALDWDYKNPMSKYPIVTVYHPSNAKYQVHANVAWAGFVGSLTGISSKVSVGEKVWLAPKNSVPMTRYGNPWTYVFRDILYDASDLSTAIEILSNAHRTCAIHVGLGSVKDRSFRMIEYSYKTLNIYDDNNYTYTKAHPKKKGIAYFDKHVQPSSDTCVGDVLTNGNFYGKWTMDSLWRVLGNSHQTGDTQLVVFDLETLTGIVSYSKFDGQIKAYARKPIKINFGNLFKAF